MTTNLLPGLPLVESPLFPALKAELGLTPEEERIANDLHERGYAVFEFPDDEIEARIARVKADLSPRFDVDFDCPECVKTIGLRRIHDAWTFTRMCVQLPPTKQFSLFSPNFTAAAHFHSRR